MTRLTAENLSLVHPITTIGSGNGGTDSTRTDNLVRNRKGRIVGVRALSDVSFDLAEGDRIGIVGSNGSGKTTLLRVLAGILPPDQGRVLTEGRATNLININLGMKNDATGHRNITLQGLAAGRSLDEIETRRDEIAEFSGLGEFLDLPVHTYSSGMRMRLCFAVSTAFEPEILLLDEWLSAGDERFKAKANERMASYVDQAGILVIASHSRALLQQNCQKILWLENGRMVDFGSAEQVLDRYYAAPE